jgi:hypothetical protein
VAQAFLSEAIAKADREATSKKVAEDQDNASVVGPQTCGPSSPTEDGIGVK